MVYRINSNDINKLEIEYNLDSNSLSIPISINSLDYYVVAVDGNKPLSTLSLDSIAGRFMDTITKYRIKYTVVDDLFLTLAFIVALLFILNVWRKIKRHGPLRRKRDDYLS